MARPTSGTSKISIKGTNLRDVISVSEAGVSSNGVFKAYSAAQIDAGFKIAGNDGNDWIIGGRGADEISGGRGDDILAGGSGYDRLLGGDGNDTLADAALGAFFDGGLGVDTIDLSEATRGVFLDIWGSGFIDDDITMVVYPDGKLAVNDWGDGVSGTVISIENIIGSGFGDLLWGNAAANVISGSGGGDELAGRAGNDWLYGDGGSDYLNGGAGADQLTGGEGADWFLFASGAAADPGEGGDVIRDYTPGEDRIVFQWDRHDVEWSQTIHEGGAALLGTYDGGRSQIIVLGVTTVDDLTIVSSPSNWTFGSS